MGSKLLVTGNGFDLAHGLPTSYNDFLLFLRAITDFKPTKEEQTRFNKAPMFSNLSESVYRYLHDYYFCLTDQSEQPEEITLIRDNLKSKYPDSNRENPWFSYFKQCKSRSHTKWIDFEKEIQKLIESLESDGVTQQSVSTLIHMTLPDNFIIHCYPSNTKEIKSAEFAHYLYQELTKFSYCFELYLKTVVAKQLEYTSDDFTVSQLIHNCPPNFVLTFNYTKTFEWLYSSITPRKNVHHLHGEVRDYACKPAENFVFGFHRPEAMSNPEYSDFIWFEKYFQRILLDRGPDFYRWLHEHEQDLETVIYGHSLDVTDRDILVSIIEKSRQTTIYYHSELAKANLVMNLVKLLTPERLAQYHADSKIVLCPAY